MMIELVPWFISIKLPWASAHGPFDVRVLNHYYNYQSELGLQSVNLIVTVSRPAFNANSTYDTYLDDDTPLT
jgi:hypothetical protein